MVSSLAKCCSSLAKRYHMRGWRRRIKLVDQPAACVEHRALIDRALVGDFAAIDRQRRTQQDRARDPGRRPRRGREKFCEPLAKGVADQWVARRHGEIIE